MIDSVPPSASCASKVRLRGPKVSSAPKPSEIRIGDRDPDPDPGEQVAAVGLDQVGDQDDDDQARLEPLAQPDQVVPQGERRTWRDSGRWRGKACLSKVILTRSERQRGVAGHSRWAPGEPCSRQESDLDLRVGWSRLLARAPGQSRTGDLSLRRRLLYPLSYWGEDRGRGHGSAYILAHRLAGANHLAADQRRAMIWATRAHMVTMGGHQGERGHIVRGRTAPQRPPSSATPHHQAGAHRGVRRPARAHHGVRGRLQEARGQHPRDLHQRRPRRRPARDRRGGGPEEAAQRAGDGLGQPRRHQHRRRHARASRTPRSCCTSRPTGSGRTA